MKPGVFEIPGSACRLRIKIHLWVLLASEAVPKELASAFIIDFRQSPEEDGLA